MNRSYEVSFITCYKARLNNIISAKIKQKCQKKMWLVILFISFECLKSKNDKKMNSPVRIYIICIFLFFVGSQIVKSQESTLWLMNGKKLTIGSYEIDKSEVDEGVLFYTDEKGSTKKKYLDDVYSVIDFKGEEKIFYKENSESGDIFTPEQMKLYLKGVNDVLENYKVPNWIIGAGFASGFLGGITPQPDIDMGRSGASLPVGILIPTVYVATVGVTNPDYEKIEKNLPNAVNNEYYSYCVSEVFQFNGLHVA